MRKMFRIICSLTTLMLFTNAFASLTIKVAKGIITIPDSSIAKPEDAGVKMHTNYKIFTPYQMTAGVPNGETPASLACVYGFTPAVPGCPINRTAIVPSGGWGTIAIVDAFDNPYAEADLNIFSATFGLPPCTTQNGCFAKIYASGTQPPANVEWGVEESLDIEWAHAMAPRARIVLVEAASDSNPDMFYAENVAGNIVHLTGGEVSNSWGDYEFPGEQAYDIYFQKSGVVYLVSSGDTGAPPNYPSTSPFVVSAGGTTIIRQNGFFVQEQAWSYNPRFQWGGSGGPSAFEMRPFYQNTVIQVVGTQRGTPDISFDANPETGVSVYNTTKGGWIVVGGTSVSSPALAGVINSAGFHAQSTAEELNYIYRQAQKNYYAFWHDIIFGNNGYPALVGYDYTTGLGSPLGYKGK